MIKAARVLAVLFFALSLSAQFRTGDIHGKVVGKDGKPLAGVMITLSRPQTADAKTVTGASGVFRFPSVFPAPDYSVRAELADFKTVTRSNIAAATGTTTMVNIALEPGKSEEQVTVGMPSSILDRGRMTSEIHFGRDELQALPTSRDPWAILQLAPSVMLDRENVGGSEASEQPAAVAKGDATNGAGNSWTIDGIDVTDPVLLGASTVNYDFDTVDEISVTTGGGADASVQAGGITVNLVTHRGGNKLAGTAHFYLTHRIFQSDNLTTDLKDEGVTATNRIQHLKDFGLSVGGPIVKNRIWWWGSYGAQDLLATTIYNFIDQTDFGNFNFKLNVAPFAGNRFEALIMASQKDRFGRDAARAKPEGDHLRGIYRLGNPIFKLQDEQAIGDNFILFVKFNINRTGITSRPTVDEDLANPVTFDVGNGVYVPFSEDYVRSWDSSSVVQKRKDLQIAATLYRDSLFGASHEFKGGLTFSDKSESRESGYVHNFAVYRNFVDPLIDLGEGLIVPPSDWQRITLGRQNRRVGQLSQASGFLQDTISKGRFTLMLGLRYDRQTPSTGAVTLATMEGSAVWSDIANSVAQQALSGVFPRLDVRSINPRYRWSTWSPRIGLTWDVRGDGKSVLRIALSQYGDVMAAGAKVTEPLGLGGGLGFWWNDEDNDGLIGPEEIFWQYSSAHASLPNRVYTLFDKDGALTDEATAALEGGFESDAYLAGNYWDYDWDDPSAVNYDNLTTFYRSEIDPEAKNVKTSPRTREIMISFDRELGPNLAASAGVTYRRYDNFDWAKPFYPADIYPETPDLVIDNNQTWYTSAGNVPDTVTIDEVEYDLKDAAGRAWYLPAANYPGETPYRMVDKSSAYMTYIGLDLNVTKRLSSRWFLNASVTLQDQRVHWGDSYIDPTNKWAIDGKSYGNWSGTADGRPAVQMHSRWLAKISALYQLPLGFDVSATFLAREGWKIPNYITLAYANNDSWPGLYRANVVYLQTPTKDSLPAFRNLSFRLEKRFTVGSAKMVLMADVFNFFNSAMAIRSYDANIGTYYVDTEEAVANPTYRRYSEILNPRVVRIGVRFEF